MEEELAKIGKAGNQGKSVRSDCYVEIELTESGGIKIDLQSKVKILFGAQIEKFAEKVIRFFDIENADVKIVDSGALEYVMAARIEYAVKQIKDTDKMYLPEMLPENKYHTEKDRYRRSRLYLPGNTPKLAINAGVHSPDGLILDLEDSVAHAKKGEARILVRNTLLACILYGAERMVRINQVPMGLEDLKYIVPYNVNLILIPKCESKDHVVQVEDEVKRIQKENNMDYPVYYMPIIESAMGVLKAYEIATASDNVVSLAIGLEDYTADLGTQRTKEGRETFFARSQVVNAARAAGIQPIDSVFSDVSDMDALRDVILESKSLGFDGMGCIHPRQIDVIHRYFAPNEKEIDKAKKIVNAFIEATEKGLGVVSLGSKMIDPPVVKRAERTIDMAIKSGILAENWREELCQ